MSLLLNIIIVGLSILVWIILHYTQSEINGIKRSMQDIGEISQRISNFL